MDIDAVVRSRCGRVLQQETDGFLEVGTDKTKNNNADLGVFFFAKVFKRCTSFVRFLVKKHCTSSDSIELNMS